MLLSLMWIKVGMLPRRSNSVCNFTAALFEGNGAHAKRLRHRSIVVDGTFEQLPLPVADLVRMHFELLLQFGQRLVFAQSRQRHAA